MWALMAFVGFSLSVKAGRQFALQNASVHCYMMLTFLVFGAGCAYVGYSLGVGKPMEILLPVWVVLTLLVGLLLTPVFYQNLLALAGDRGGICLEGGFLGMVVGMMVITSQAYRLLPFVGCICLACFCFGYARLQKLLHK